MKFAFYLHNISLIIKNLIIINKLHQINIKQMCGLEILLIIVFLVIGITGFWAMTNGGVITVPRRSTSTSPGWSRGYETYVI